MKKLIAAPIIVATLTASSFALAGGPDADTNPGLVQSVLNKSDVVFGADLGYAWSAPADQNHVYSDNSVFTKFSDSKGRLAWGGHVGYRYAVMPALKVGAEVGYMNFGKGSNTGTSADQGDKYDFSMKAQTVTFLATVNYLLANHYDFFVKGGGAYVRQTSNFDYLTGGPGNYSKRDDLSRDNAHDEGVRPYISVGAGYTFDKFEVSVAYDHLFGTTSSNKDVQWVSPRMKFKKDIFSQNAVVGGLSYALPL